jgi:hypothetical protein
MPLLLVPTRITTHVVSTSKYSPRLVPRNPTRMNQTSTGASLGRPSEACCRFALGRGRSPHCHHGQVPCHKITHLRGPDRTLIARREHSSTPSRKSETQSYQPMSFIVGTRPAPNLTRRCLDSGGSIDSLLDCVAMSPEETARGDVQRVWSG